MKLRIAILVLTAPLTVLAQTAPIKPELLLYHPPTPLAYEVATIKPLDPKAAGDVLAIRLPPGVTLSPLSIRRYIMNAYNASYQAQVIDGPEWLDKDSYHITVKPPADREAAMRDMNLSEAANQNRAMAQSLLVERFHLKAHFETRMSPVYELVPAKSGLKIIAVPAPPERKPGYVPPPPPPQQSGTRTPPPPPGTSIGMRTSTGLQIMNASAITIQMLARNISFGAATELEPRPIVDHTGFIGYFDIKDLTWAPLSANTTDPSGSPSLQRALEDQLGIKLQPARAPIEVLVIDSIDRPSEN